jgi:hypothetical protein
MEITNGSLTIFAHKEHVEITVTDENSHVDLVKVNMTPANFCAALGRLANVRAKLEVSDRLDIIGKMHEVAEITFPLPKSVDSMRSPERDEAAKKAAIEYCKKHRKDWTPDLYFHSQNSYFYDDKGGLWARTHIRRWT